MFEYLDTLITAPARILFSVRIIYLSAFNVCLLDTVFKYLGPLRQEIRAAEELSRQLFLETADLHDARVSL